MKRAVKQSKRKTTNRAKNKVMSFDFRVDEDSPFYKDTESIDNIIGDVFTMNQNSPCSEQSKSIPYKNNMGSEITKQFTQFQDYKCNQKSDPQELGKINREVSIDLRKPALINKVKKVKMQVNNVQKQYKTGDAQDYSYAISDKKPAK
jgi:hypothetical protein